MNPQSDEAPEVQSAATRAGATEVASEPVFRAQGGSLYVVATPLGNLRDITRRALDVLATADVIAAEDTRVSSVLLRHYGITSTLMSLHAHNEQQRAATLVAHLAQGRSVALVTDAGTPGVSDPGARVVRAVREAGFAVIPVPGASAAIAAISAAGLTAERFLFVGFLPAQGKARRADLARLRTLPCALVFYEAPHRVHDMVADLATALDPGRTLVIAREVTKRFESITAMPLEQGTQWLEGDTNRTRGEFVVIVDEPIEEVAAVELDPRDQRWLEALAQHLSPAQAARVAAIATGVPRDVIYQDMLARRGER